MSETPSPDQPTQSNPRSYTGGGVTVDVARLPIPGNAEFALYLVALIIAWIVAWASDVLDAAQAATARPSSEFCRACFTREYPTRVPAGRTLAKLRFEAAPV